MKAYRTYDSNGAYMGRLLLDNDMLVEASVTRRGDVVRIVEPVVHALSTRVYKQGGQWRIDIWHDGVLVDYAFAERASRAYLFESQMIRHHYSI